MEYDDAWRRLGPPALREDGRAWQCARGQQPPLGVGQASVWWDARELELCDPKLVQDWDCAAMARCAVRSRKD